MRRCRCGDLRAEGLGPCLACQSYEAIGSASPAAPITLEDFERLCIRAGRIHEPRLLWLASATRVIDPAVVTAVAGDAWNAAEYPEKALGRAEWLKLFSVAGFTVDGKPAEPPAEPVRLWRGSVPSRRRGMAWTATRSVAERFAAGMLYGRQPGRVYETVAPPVAILCVDNGRSEAEHVIDTRGLTITAVAR